VKKDPTLDNKAGTSSKIDDKMTIEAQKTNSTAMKTAGGTQAPGTKPTTGMSVPTTTNSLQNPKIVTNK